MLRVPSYLLPLAASLAFTASAHAQDSRAQETPGNVQPAGRIYRVAAIGDSLTDARSHGGKYLDWLRIRCPESRFDNYGRGGENVAQMRRRFARNVLSGAKGYTHVIVFGGVNDVLGGDRLGRTTAHIVEDIDTMYALAREAGIEVIGVTVSPWTGYSEYYTPKKAAATLDVNRWIRSQAESGRIAYVLDAYELLSCGESGRLCASYEMRWIRDGLHFNADAHEKLGRALHQSVFADCR